MIITMGRWVRQEERRSARRCSGAEKPKVRQRGSPRFGTWNKAVALAIANWKK